MKVRIKLEEELLGSQAANKEIHAEYIASQSKDAQKAEEELASLPADELMDKKMQVFHRDTDGMPMLYDYQIKGFIKEAMSVLVELSDKEVRIGKTKLSKYTVKRIVDNMVFVYPRRIRLSPVVGICTRPLRAITMQGERVSLVSSEVVAAGTEFDVEIKTLVDSLDKLVEQSLDYGSLKGLGQWRNSGKGRFSWVKC